ncbi:unnamed protein product, partial [Sphacelaria rigidula]
SQVAVISRPADYKAALLDIADADQISPEYGGTGRRLADLASLGDALLAAGNPGSGGGNGSSDHHSVAAGGRTDHSSVSGGRRGGDGHGGGQVESDGEMERG